MLDLRRFDAYRATHPDTRLAASGYYYPIGANRGYVGLAGNTDLLDAVNKALSELQGEGVLAKLGQAAGLTYLPPREPAILGDAMQKVLLARLMRCVIHATETTCGQGRNQPAKSGDPPS